MPGEEFERGTHMFGQAHAISMRITPQEYSKLTSGPRSYSQKRRIVMNRIATLALFVAATFISVDNASAQNQVKVNVPFSFTVGTSTMPAGSYTIRSDSGSRNLVYLTNWGENTKAMALGITEQGNLNEAGKLVFHRVGDQYFLSEIRCSN